MAIKKMNPAGSEPSAAVVQQAAEWFATVGVDGRGSEANRRAFSRWLNADPTHRVAFERLRALWARMAGAQAKPTRAALQAVLDAGRGKSTGKARRRARKKALPVVAALIGAGWLWASSPMAWLADHHTGAGERRTVVLADRSELTLNTRSAVDINFSPSERRLQLRQGEVLLEVAKDATRPLIVESAHGTARALGTRFIVRREDEADVVTVVESRVRVCPAEAAPSACRDIDAGNRARVTDTAIVAVEAVDTDVAQAWSQGKLAIDDRPLTEVLDELQRYRRGIIRYDRDDLATVRVSGVFPLDDPDRALDALAEGLPITVEHYSRWFVVVARR